MRRSRDGVGVGTGDKRPAQVIVAGIVTIGVAARLLFAGAPGFPSDVGTFMAWAERLAALGPGRFYEPGYFSDYPPGFLYVLWAFGALLDGDALRFAVKAVSIPFDVAIAVVAAALAWRAGGARAATVAAAAWMLAPGIVFAGTYWGQVDAVGTLPLLLALVAAGTGRWPAAGALAALAAMIKPQFGLGLILIVAGAAFIFIREGSPRPVARAGLAALAVILALALPFRAGPVELIALVRSASETYPYTSLYAFNPWSIGFDFWKPDTGLVVLGGALLAIGVAASAAPLWRRRDTAAFLACGACAVFAFYFLPTRAHERYLFPAFALLLPLVAVRPRLAIPYAVLAAGFVATLYLVFAKYDLVHVPGLIDATFFARQGQIAIAVLMTGAATLIAWRLARGEARLAAVPREPRAGRASSDTAPAAPDAGGSAAEPTARWRLPSGLGPGFAPTRRDVALALLIAIAVLGTRGYRLDFPRDMYFDEVYHARTAFELLAQRDVYEWTHPHLAKELMALGILAFGNDRVAGRETISKSDPITALAVTNDGLRVYALGSGRLVLRERSGRDVGEIDIGRAPIRGIAVDGGRAYAATDRELVEIDLGARAVIARTALQVAGSVSGIAAAAGRVVVATGQAAQITGTGPAVIVRTPVAALALRADGSTVYLVDPQGTTHVVGTADGVEKSAHPAAGPVGGVAHALSADRLFLARTDIPALEVIDLEGGKRQTVMLANARTGAVTQPASALAVVPRTQFLHVLAGDRLIAVETHGSSPYASLAVSGERLAVDGTADELLVGDASGATRVATGRQALSWRIPGVVAGAVLAFFIVLLARRLFASRLAPAIAGLVVLLDGSMFAQARIGMNDVYVAAFLAAGWYFVVAAHAPRRSARLDLVLAGALFGLAAASKWVAFYALAGLGVLALAVTAYAYARERGRGGPLDLLRGRGLNAVFLVCCFAVLPLMVYLLSYVPWFGGPTIPYGWDLRELTQQMYWYHSGLTSPHPAGSPWWSWPLVLKPVYWYYGQSEGGSAVIYDAGNVVLYWGALAAVVWCAIAAVRARSLSLGLVVFALAVQLMAWAPITRVLFFYHFFTALPWYFLALTAALVYLWERGRAPVVGGYLTLAAAAFVFFYPFVSGQPVAADQTGAFFILPTWQYECQFYPAFTCDLKGATQLSGAALLSRLAPPLAFAALLAAGWLALGRAGGLRALEARWAARRGTRR